MSASLIHLLVHLIQAFSEQGPCLRMQDWMSLRESSKTGFGLAAAKA